MPVYLGAPNVGDFAPGDNAFIDASKFAGPHELAEYIAALDRDDEAYRRYFEWRERGLSAGFQELLADASKEPFCRLCELVTGRLAKTGIAG